MKTSKPFAVTLSTKAMAGALLLPVLMLGLATGTQNRNTACHSSR
jgi:hypothetical protein